MQRQRRWLLLLMVLLGLMGLAACTSGGSYRQVSPKTAYKLLQEKAQDPNFVILDVRTPEEFQAGHIQGAININLYAPDFQQQLAQLDRDKTYFVYCRTGHRSRQAVQIMQKMGFRNIYELQGGIVNWVQAGLPVVSGQ